MTKQSKDDSSGSWYSMQRGWMEHPLFKSDPYSRAQAWEWLISEACFDACKTRINGKGILLDRGQLTHSIRFIAAKWLWSKGKTERFIACLKTEAMIETDSESGILIITICNYNTYQPTKRNSGTQTETLIGTRAGHERDTSGTENNNIITKELNKSKKEYPLPPKGGEGELFPVKEKSRGTRFQPHEGGIPKDWYAFALNMGWADTKIHKQYINFSDYWAGVSGERGVKMDWFATWRNRCRDVEERSPTSLKLVTKTPWEIQKEQDKELGFFQ